MMGKIRSDVVNFPYVEDPKNIANKNFNNLLDAYLSDSEERKISTCVDDSFAPDGQRMADILLRALIIGAAEFEDNLNEKGQQRIKQILGDLSKEEVVFASQELEKVSVTFTESVELPTILPTMEEIDVFLEESILSKA